MLTVFQLSILAAGGELCIHFIVAYLLEVIQERCLGDWEILPSQVSDGSRRTVRKSGTPREIHVPLYGRRKLVLLDCTGLNCTAVVAYDL
jgi:hypothetical protein